MIWRWFWREWRSPSLLIVWLALTLAVVSVGCGYKTVSCGRKHDLALVLA
ncbi:permease [Yersinia enterocolitica]|nr:hypothetical protein [Yersinia enterocolitica]CNE09611.1 permease [Yersinia enterocolitica]